MTHTQAREELDRGTPAELICATCPWDRLCVEPPQMSTKEIERQIKEAETKDLERDPTKSAMPVSMILTTLVYAGKDNAGKLCPVFALRLRGPDGRRVADGLREQMRGWTEVPS